MGPAKASHQARSAKTVRAPYSPANLADIEKPVADNWKLMSTGERTVKDAMDEITTQVDRLLKPT